MNVFNSETRRSLIAALQFFIEENDASLIRDAVAKARTDVDMASPSVSLLRELHDLMDEVPAVAALAGSASERNLVVARLIEACLVAYYPEV